MPHTADRQPTQTRQAEIVAAVLALSASQGPGTITTQGRLSAALTLTASDIKAPKNSEACVSVTARDFQNILSMQYTMQWDPKVLKFKAVQNYGLPGMKDNNFSDHLANEGKLTFSWYDPRLVGLTQPEGVKLYDVCFDIVGKPGTASKFEFTGIPTVIEIADARGTFLDLRTEGGAITVED